MTKAKLKKNSDPVIHGIKGFDKDMKCRGIQFEIGQTYTHEGDVVACRSGYHAVPNDLHPLTVFEFYAPAGNRFCRVEVSGKTDREENKIAAEILEVGEEIGLRDLTLDAVKWVMDRATPEGQVAVKNNGLATASGDQGAATASGYLGKVKGADGSALFSVERATWNGPILSVACGVVGVDGIKADVWYHCQSGKLVEA